MESEKVKEIKKALEEQGNCGIIYEVNNHKKTCKFINYTDILTLINELESENERLKKDNELLRNAKVVYENVDYCYEDLKKAEKRIAELEKELTNDRVFYKDGICYPMNCQGALKQFAERLKENFEHHHGNYGDLSYSECAKVIDETLKEFLDAENNEY